MTATTVLASDDMLATSVCAAATHHLEIDSESAERSLCIAIIGSGNVYRNIALAMLQAQHRVIVYDGAGHGSRTLECAGARVATSIQDACSSADLVFTTPAGDDAMDAIVLGAGGIAQCLRRNCIHISLGSMSVGCTDRIVEAHWNAGQRYISAPVIGFPQDAGIGQLRMVAAGPEEVISEVQPVLDAAGEVATKIYGWPSQANALQHEPALETVI